MGWLVGAMPPRENKGEERVQAQQALHPSLRLLCLLVVGDLLVCVIQ